MRHHCNKRISNGTDLPPVEISREQLRSGPARKLGKGKKMATEWSPFLVTASHAQRRDHVPSVIYSGAAVSSALLAGAGASGAVLAACARLLDIVSFSRIRADLPERSRR